MTIGNAWVMLVLHKQHQSREYILPLKKIFFFCFPVFACWVHKPQNDIEHGADIAIGWEVYMVFNLGP